MLQRQYSRVVRLFQQQKKSDELAQLFMEIDLHAVGRYFIVSNLVANMMREKGQEEAAVKLFQKAWLAFPACFRSFR